MKLFSKTKYRYKIYIAIIGGTPIIANLKLSGIALEGDINNLTIHSCEIDKASNFPCLIIKKHSAPTDHAVVVG